MQANANASTRLIALGSGFLVICALLGFAAMHFLVEIWWHASLNMLLYYLMRVVYRDLIAFAITLVQGGFIFVNFIVIPKMLRVDPVEMYGGSGLKNRLAVLLLTPSIRLALICVAIFTMPILTPIYLHWEDFLLFFFNAGSSMKDPVFAVDASFYLLSFPLIKLVQNEMLAVFSLLFVTIAACYFLVKRQQSNKQPLSDGAKIHLTLLIAVIVSILAWSIYMERFEILYVDRHQPVYFGPGFVEMNFQLPLIWLNFLFFIVAAIAAVVYLYTRRGLKWLYVSALIYVAMLAFKQTHWIPALIDRFYVIANPVTAERNNIAYNIKATLQGFGLDQVDSVDYPLKNESAPFNNQAIKDVLKNIPLWDHELLLAGYDQMQAIRPFFGFKDVAVDRYRLEGINVQVNVAARELNFNQLPASAKTWNNRHFIYTHGYGLVMTPSLQQANQPMQWLIRDLNNLTDYDQLNIKKPQMFYGMADYDYAITPNDARPLQPDDSTFRLRNDLPVDRGVTIASWLRRMVLSAYFQDFDLLFTTNMTENSRMLFRRNIIERVSTLAPFLTLDPKSYPVVINNKIYWIVDAYTTSDHFPVVANVDFPLEGGMDAKPVNYLRNSVKIIIDAYNGDVDFYLIDSNDPIAMTYRNIYPMLFKDASEIPQPFINHLSYPSRLFALQMAVYARYHQTNPDVYYQQSEAMTFPQLSGKKMLPYFLTLIPEGGVSKVNPNLYRFLLVAPMAQIGRDNLGMIAMAGCIKAADCQSSYSADIVNFRFPINQQVEGPAQIDGLINQDPEISRQLTLWQQRGASVIKGRMIIVPVDGRLLYIQPVYTRAMRSTGFPQLTRVIIAMNRVVAMDISLESAFEKLKAKLGV